MPDEIGSCVSQDGNCPICGQGIFRRKMKCPVCKTPHHEECWDYNEKCGMYACNGVKTVEAPKNIKRKVKTEVQSNSFYDIQQWLPHIPK
jgi:C4-type Zn-finger protein